MTPLSKALKPTPESETYVDTGYVSGENIIEAEQEGVSLQGPVAGKPADEDQLSVADFALNAERTGLEESAKSNAAPPARRRSSSRSNRTFHTSVKVGASGGI